VLRLVLILRTIFHFDLLVGYFERGGISFCWYSPRSGIELSDKLFR